MVQPVVIPPGLEAAAAAVETATAAIGTFRLTVDSSIVQVVHDY